MIPRQKWAIIIFYFFVIKAQKAEEVALNFADHTFRVQYQKCKRWFWFTFDEESYPGGISKLLEPQTVDQQNLVLISQLVRSRQLVSPKLKDSVNVKEKPSMSVFVWQMYLQMQTYWNNIYIGKKILTKRAFTVIIKRHPNQHQFKC